MNTDEIYGAETTPISDITRLRRPLVGTEPGVGARRATTR